MDLRRLGRAARQRVTSEIDGPEEADLTAVKERSVVVGAAQIR
jgi:hypothetical protein